MKSKYITPEITVVEFKVEAGFAASGDLQFNNGAFSMQEQGDGGYEATQMSGSPNTDYQSIFN